MRKARVIGIARLLVIVLALLLSHAPADAAPATQTGNKELVVAVKSIPPFVIIEDERITGFSIDLWEELAKEIEATYEYVVVETVEEQLQMLEDGDADLAIAAITVNSEREELFDFAYPYYDSGLQIMTGLGGGQAVRGLAAVALSPESLQIILGFLLTMFFIGNLAWLSERKKNSEEFPQSYLKGVWEGIWWSVVTVTTVGYGDRAPRTIIGRILGMFTIIFGLFLIANFTASITTQLTLEGIRSPIDSIEDLPGKRVVTVLDSTSAEYLTENFVRYSTTETIEEAVEQLIDDQVDAVVYDAPILQFLANTQAKGQAQVVGSILQPEQYAIAFPLDSLNRKEVNKALLESYQNGAYQEIHAKWFGE